MDAITTVLGRLTETDAKWIKTLRNLGFAFGGVAKVASRKWNTNWGPNDYIGILLVEKSAKLLGEQTTDAPWNVAEE